jgi:hypothetical protein
VVVIVWLLDLQLHLHSDSVHITTKVVSSNPVHGEVYSIQYYVLKFVSDLQQWGSPIPFPTGGACVLSVIRFQDGGRRSAVVSAEAQI